MALNSGIEYVDHSWNPWVGCHPVSEGCRNCYMYREQRRFGQDPTVVRRTGEATWRQVKKFKTWSTVFVCSWSDFFIEEADAWRADAWRAMASRRDVEWVIVTKRPERIAGRLPWNDKLPWPNVVGMVTAENQKMADLRVPILLRASFQFYGLSVEPMLGPVDITSPTNFLDWVVCGCESGPQRRKTGIDWIRRLRDQCRLARIPFFLKQMEVGVRVVKMPALDDKRWSDTWIPF